MTITCIHYVWGSCVTSPVGTLRAGSPGCSCPPRGSGVQECPEKTPVCTQTTTPSVCLRASGSRAVGCACHLDPGRVRASESPADPRPSFTSDARLLGCLALSQPPPPRWPWLAVRPLPSPCPQPSSSCECSRGSQALGGLLPDPQGLGLAKVPVSAPCTPSLTCRASQLWG